jgi:glutathione S-transferase
MVIGDPPSYLRLLLHLHTWLISLHSFAAEKVDIGAHKTASGEDYYTINPSGGVPTLRLENGEFLTEGVAIMQYIADKVRVPCLSISATTAGLLTFIFACRHPSLTSRQPTVHWNVIV